MHDEEVLERILELGDQVARRDRLVADLVDALFAELRDKYPRTAMTDDDIWEYLASEHGIARIEGVTPWQP